MTAIFLNAEVSGLGDLHTLYFTNPIP